MFAAPRRGAAAESAERTLSPEAAERIRCRRDDFDLFRGYASDFFAAPPADEGHERMAAQSGFHFALGAEPKDAKKDAKGKKRPARAVDPRVIEAFYGTRRLEAFDQVEADRLKASWDKASETGAALLYVQGDDGVVSAFLYPAAIEGMKPEEDAILLARFSQTEALTGKGLLESHWAFLRAYAEASSLDGEPGWLDHLRVAWLRLTCRRLVDGRLQPTALWGAGLRGLGLALAVAAGVLIAT